MYFCYIRPSFIVLHEQIQKSKKKYYTLFPFIFLLGESFSYIYIHVSIVLLIFIIIKIYSAFAKRQIQFDRSNWPIRVRVISINLCELYRLEMAPHYVGYRYWTHDPSKRRIIVKRKRFFISLILQ